MTELTKDDRVRKEILRIKKLLRELPEDRLKIADGIIRRAAFMQVTLEDLEDDIKVNGTTENFSQARDIEYDRERPSVRIYNTLVKNYAAAMKQIVDMLPQNDTAKKKDQLLEFLKR
jgi:hypothetical protein